MGLALYALAVLTLTAAACGHSGFLPTRTLLRLRTRPTSHREGAATAPDTHTGAFGTAERVPPARYQADSPASLDSWVITAPCWHPLWRQYSLSVVTLAELPGVPAPVIQRPGATHEAVVVALNPDHGPYDARTITLTAGGLHHLTPVNIHAQFTATDDQARELAELCARAVVDGVLCPETTDAPDQIRKHWGQTIENTLQHHLHHPPH